MSVPATHAWMRTGGLLAALVIAVLVLAPHAAEAAVPPNDSFAGAQVIPALPFSATLDTTEATTDADDAEVSALCGFSVDASVWYRVTPTVSGQQVIDVSDSSYTAAVAVLTGSPGSFGLVNCFPDHVQPYLVAGQTYTIMVFDATAYDGVGGTLQLSIHDPPTVSVTLAPRAHVSRTGVVTLTGTFTCTNGNQFVFAPVLEQQVGKYTIISPHGISLGIFIPARCDGTPETWSTDVTGENGRFAGGWATLYMAAAACGKFGCGRDDLNGVRVC